MEQFWKEGLKSWGVLAQKYMSDAAWSTRHPLMKLKWYCWGIQGILNCQIGKWKNLMSLSFQIRVIFHRETAIKWRPLKQLVQLWTPKAVHVFGGACLATRELSQCQQRLNNISWIFICNCKDTIYFQSCHLNFGQGLKKGFINRKRARGSKYRRPSDCGGITLRTGSVIRTLR